MARRTGRHDILHHVRSISLASLPLLLVVSGCSFNPPAVDGPPGNRDGGGDIDAAPVPDDATPDANLACGGQALSLALSVNGVTQPAAPGDPFVEVLVGDLVEISAAGSCASAGDLAIAWDITPDNGILATASPALADAPEVFTVYATTPGDYTLELAVSGSGALPLSTSVLAIRAIGWQATTAPSGMSDVRDLSIGGGNMWIASNGGAYMLPLDGAPDAFSLVNDAIENGDSISSDLDAVLYDQRNDFVWFGRGTNDTGPWRIETATMDSVKLAYDGSDALNGTALVHDIAAAGTDTILMATSRGITAITGTDGSFTGAEKPNTDTAQALAANADRRMAGARRLYDLALGPDGVFDVFSVTDNKIRTMVIDDAKNVLWAGSDDQGVAELDLATDTLVKVHGTADGLGSLKIRALAIETQGDHAGDVWAATDTGVSRYISRRQTWLHMDENHGLTNSVDIKALAIDAAPGRRVIYAGSTNGVVYIRRP
jgi:ligand-binding sensor domain-containing protein